MLGKPVKKEIMETDGPDCLIGKFSCHQDLTDGERSFLQDLQKDERSIEGGTEVIQQDETSDQLYVLKSGWAYAYKVLRNGQRQVLEFLLPGDFLGIREFAYNSALNYVVACGDCTICPFPKERMEEIFVQYPRLTGTLMQMSTREQVVLMERVVNLGSRDAHERMAHLFMELYMRLSAVKLNDGLAFRFPVSQSVLADALGLSKVHTNRTLKRLREEGLLTVSNGLATVQNMNGLISAAQFESFYLNDENLRSYFGKK